MLIDPYDDEAQDILLAEQRQRAYQRELNAHPHCSDPYHPGCALCDEEGDEDE